MPLSGLRRSRSLWILLALAVTAGCDDLSVSTQPTLRGLWLLDYRDPPVILGMVSGQVLFRDDGTVLFQGAAPGSPEFPDPKRVEGVWSRSHDRVTLTLEGVESVWSVDFEGEDRVTFTATEGSRYFLLFRPLPD